MPLQVEQMIDQLSFRVRLLIETTGMTFDKKEISERDLIFMEYLQEMGEVGFSTISAFFKKVSPSTVSNTLKKLHLKGLVARREDPNDLRSNYFRLTDKGRKFLGPVRKEQQELSQIITDSLQLTADESAVVAEVITRAIRNFDGWLGLPDVSGDDGSLADVTASVNVS